VSGPAFLGAASTYCCTTHLSRIVRSLSQRGRKVVYAAVERWGYSGGSISSNDSYVGLFVRIGRLISRHV
jgi:hypothetical protein